MYFFSCRCSKKSSKGLFFLQLIGFRFPIVWQEVATCPLSCHLLQQDFVVVYFLLSSISPKNLFFHIMLHKVSLGDKNEREGLQNVIDSIIDAAATTRRSAYRCESNNSLPQYNWNCNQGQARLSKLNFLARYVPYDFWGFAVVATVWRCYWRLPAHQGYNLLPVCVIRASLNDSWAPLSCSLYLTIIRRLEMTRCGLRTTMLCDVFFSSQYLMHFINIPQTEAAWPPWKLTD